MRIDLDWTEDSRDPLWLYAPIDRILPVQRDDVGTVLKALTNLGYYDPEQSGIPAREQRDVHDAIERFQSDHGLERDGVMQPSGPTLFKLNQIFERRREEKFWRGREANNARRQADGRGIPVVRTGLQNAVFGPRPAADAAAWRPGRESLEDTDQSEGHGAEDRPFFAQRPQQGRPSVSRPRNTRDRQAAPALRNRGTPVPAPQPRVAPPRDPYPPPGIFSPPPPAGPPEPGWPPRRIFGQRPIGPGPNDPKLLPSFADRISWAEGNSSYDTIGVSDERGNRALGRYQMLPDALVSASVLAPDGRSWTGPIARQFGLRNSEDFLRNHAAQEAALRAFLTEGQRQLRAHRLDRYIGRVIDGVVGHIAVSYAGLMAAIHRYGAGGTAAYLALLEVRGWRTRDRALTNRERRIETRLRVFQNEQYSTE